MGWRGGGDNICGRRTISASGLCPWGTISASGLCPGGQNLRGDRICSDTVTKDHSRCITLIPVALHPSRCNPVAIDHSVAIDYSRRNGSFPSQTNIPVSLLLFPSQCTIPVAMDFFRGNRSFLSQMIIPVARDYSRRKRSFTSQWIAMPSQWNPCPSQRIIPVAIL